MRTSARVLVSVAALVVGAVALAAPAGAAGCTVNGTAVTVDVGDGETATIGRDADAITLNGTACGAATVATVDTIAVNATGAPAEVAIDESAGRFEPGATAEPEGASEIEFTVNLPTGSPALRVIGTAEGDVVAIAGSGINLNADEATADVDMTITGTPLVSIEGAAGDDMLSVDGPASASAFEGGEGVDTIDFGAASGGVSVDLKAGTVGGQGSLMLKAVENVTGSPGDDEIVGDEQANVLAGGDGDDVIDGGGEADTLLGGDGRDTVSFASSNKAVQVDLKKGTAEGAGADTLDGFEDVEGSRKADAIRGDGSENTLDGSKGIDRVRGGNGDDDLLGAEGNDLLFGEKGNDVLQGETGKDQLNGGEGNDRCKGGPDADAFVFCEHLS